MRGIDLSTNAWLRTSAGEKTESLIDQHRDPVDYWIRSRPVDGRQLPATILELLPGGRTTEDGDGQRKHGGGPYSAAFRVSTTALGRSEARLPPSRPLIRDESKRPPAAAANASPSGQTDWRNPARRATTRITEWPKEFVLVKARMSLRSWACCDAADGSSSCAS